MYNVYMLPNLSTRPQQNYVNTPKDMEIILGDIPIGRKLIVQKSGIVMVYTTYIYLANSTNQINIPTNGIITYNGSYSQPEIYSFTYNRQTVLISQGSLYNMLKTNMLH